MVDLKQVSSCFCTKNILSAVADIMEIVRYSLINLWTSDKMYLQVRFSLKALQIVQIEVTLLPFRACKHRLVVDVVLWR